MPRAPPQTVTDLPAVPTLIAQHERCHGLIGAARLHLGWGSSRSVETSWCPPNQGPLGTRPDLVVGAVLLLALAALEEVSDGAARLGHLVLPDGLLGHGIPQLLQLIAGHLLPLGTSVGPQGSMWPWLCSHPSTTVQHLPHPLPKQDESCSLCLLESSDPSRCKNHPILKHPKTAACRDLSPHKRLLRSLICAPWLRRTNEDPPA